MKKIKEAVAAAYLQKDGTCHTPGGHGKGTESGDYKTDTVMQVLYRRIRSTKKKIKKIEQIEEMVEKSKDINEDQASNYKKLQSLNAIVEEIEKISPLVKIALENEINDHIEKALHLEHQSKEKDEKKKEFSSAEEEEEEFKYEGSNENLESPRSLSEHSQANISSSDKISIDKTIEFLYFLKLFGSKDFDISNAKTESSSGSYVPLFNEEEMQAIEQFYKKIFPNDSHIPLNALIDIKLAVVEAFENQNAISHNLVALMERAKDSSLFMEEVPVVKNAAVSIESHKILEENISESEDPETPDVKGEETLLKVTVAKQEEKGEGMQQPIRIVENQPRTQKTPIKDTPQKIAFTNIALSNNSRPFLPFHNLYSTTGDVVNTSQSHVKNQQGISQLCGQIPAISPVTASQVQDVPNPPQNKLPNPESTETEEVPTADQSEDVKIKDESPWTDFNVADKHEEIVNAVMTRGVEEEGLEARAREPRVLRQQRSYNMQNRQFSGGRGSYGGNSEYRNQGNTWIKHGNGTGGRNYNNNSRGGGYGGRGGRGRGERPPQDQRYGQGNFQRNNMSGNENSNFTNTRSPNASGRGAANENTGGYGRGDYRNGQQGRGHGFGGRGMWNGRGRGGYENRETGRYERSGGDYGNRDTKTSPILQAIHQYRPVPAAGRQMGNGKNNSEQ